jgi:hypothetical protein
VIFKHRHRFKWADTEYEPSLATGIPLAVGKVYRCRCGDERREITPAGMQQEVNRFSLDREGEE